MVQGEDVPNGGCLQLGHGAFVIIEVPVVLEIVGFDPELLQGGFRHVDRVC